MLHDLLLLLYLLAWPLTLCRWLPNTASNITDKKVIGFFFLCLLQIFSQYLLDNLKDAIKKKANSENFYLIRYWQLRLLYQIWLNYMDVCSYLLKKLHYLSVRNESQIPPILPCVICWYLMHRHATEKHAKPDSDSQHVQCSQYSMPGFPY